MLPATPDLLGWIADGLSSLLLREEDGQVHCMAGSDVPDGVTIEEKLRAFARAEERDGISQLLLAARQGVRGNRGLADGTQVFAWAEGAALCTLILRPPDPAVARKAAASDLAAGVTHEVANALTAITGWAKMAASGGPLPEKTREALDVVQRSARDALTSARGLLRTMRDAGRDSVPPPPPEGTTDAGFVVEQALATLRPEVELGSMGLTSDLDVDAACSAPPVALRLIVGNLVRNAFEALSAGGAIHVALRQDGDRVCLSVSDNGPGMNRRTLAQAFDRYFTTKDHGTGLGLALVRDTVEEAGGRIEVESFVGKGTRFDVWLPRQRESMMMHRPPQVRTTSGVHPKPPNSQFTILVVDDDDALRSMIRTALELSGMTVVTAQSAAEALGKGGSFDLAVVDLAIGTDRGDELIGQLKAHSMVQRVILMTGSVSADTDAAIEADAVMRKPFELSDLTDVIDQVLAGGPHQAEG